MRLRATLAAVLAFVLVSTSCFAAACHLTCSLNASGSSCHHQGTATSTMTMRMETHDCPMHSHKKSNGTAVGQFEGMDICGSPACAQTPQAVEGEQSASFVHLYPVVSAVLVSLVYHFEGSGSVEFRLPDTPPLRPALLVSLQTTLRI